MASLGAVSDAKAGVNDSRVSAGTVGKARGNIPEQLLRGRRRHQESGGLTAGVQCIPLAQRDHLLDQRAAWPWRGAAWW